MLAAGKQGSKWDMHVNPHVSAHHWGGQAVGQCGCAVGGIQVELWASQRLRQGGGGLACKAGPTAAAAAGGGRGLLLACRRTTAACTHTFRLHTAHWLYQEGSAGHLGATPSGQAEFPRRQSGCSLPSATAPERMRTGWRRRPAPPVDKRPSRGGPSLCEHDRVARQLRSKTRESRW